MFSGVMFHSKPNYFGDPPFMETPETMEGEKLIVGGMIHSNPMEKWDKVGNLEVMDISSMTL